MTDFEKTSRTTHRLLSVGILFCVVFSVLGLVSAVSRFDVSAQTQPDSESRPSNVFNVQ